MIRHLLCGLANSSALFSLSHISLQAVASAPSLFSNLNRAVDGISSFGSFAAGRRASTQCLEPVSPDEPVPKGQHVYTLEIVTGNLRGAGTLTPATVQVCGEYGCTNTFLVGTGGGADGEEGDVGFEKASIKKYMFHADHDLGRLKRVMVEKRQHSMTELDASGWFLERIVVGTPDGEAVSFPCQSWLGQSNFNDSRGELYRNLSPCVVPLSMELPPSPVSVISGGVAIPHPDKLKEGLRGSCTREFGYAGEDAYFCTSGKNGVHGMGVADGVYMWRNLGIDSGIFSRNLAATARHMVEQGYLDVMNVLSFTSRHVRSEGVFGSSTICLVTIDRTVGRLNSANLGDSGFMVIGNSEQRNKPHIKFRTPQLEHQFGWPFQIGHAENADQPGDAMQATLRIVPGDLIVMGSDGLFDNVHDEDIMAACLKGKADGMRPMALAQSLANIAHTNSWSSDLVTPYSMAATEEFNMVYAGGKKDDITVVVAFVGEPAADKEKRRQPGQSRHRA